MPIAFFSLLGISHYGFLKGMLIGLFIGGILGWSAKEVDKKCKWCGREFRGIRAGSYCSNKCRKESGRR